MISCYGKLGRYFPLIPPLLRIGAGIGSKPMPNAFLLPGVPETIAVYGSAAAVRVAVYLACLPGGAFGQAKPQPNELHNHWMSDHILLGSSMTAGLAVEAALLAAFLSQGLRLNAASTCRIVVSFGCSALLFVLTTVDMHYQRDSSIL
ncbi:uncharacterized protein LOC142356176 [Convolutriloba macropyga]|uniref:uncharacterized protein LOC142356176 n=1 Tax=Convolutriloba macropyga TaxID=536237 RepID=UPI003F523C1D